MNPTLRRVLGFALRQVGRALLVLWIVATVVYLALRATGDPLVAILGGPGSQASDEAIAAATERYGLDQPLVVQYLAQLWQVATFDLGTSYSRRMPVADLLAAQLPGTLLLAVCALVVAWLLAVGGRLLVALGRGRVARLADRMLGVCEITAGVIPQFWLGALLIVLFAGTWRLLPATSSGNDLASLVLPSLTLAIPLAGFLAQLSRDALVIADASPFALAARARGVSEVRLLLHHTLRHAALPAVALSGWAFGNLLSGAVVVEVLFGRPGIGRLLQEATLARDVPVVIGTLLVITLCYLVVLTIADLAELTVDPRLRRRARSAEAVG